MSNNKKNPWNIEQPIFAMAPMADVTDAAFRQMFVKCGRPDIVWTEFVSADGLFLAPEQGRNFWLPERLREVARSHGVAGDNPLLKDLIFSENEQPIIAQFFSRDPDRMGRATKLCVDLGFSGIDINMGCPAKVIVEQGAGCAMIKEPDTALRVIKAALEGADGKIPVSVKTRTGFSSDLESIEWLSLLLDSGIEGLSLHARTRKDMSKVPARWENLVLLKELRDKINPGVKILGNGDITSLENADQRILETGVDGVMVGRALFGNPWFFNRDIVKKDLPVIEVLQILKEHIALFDLYLGDTKSFSIMRKHFKSYLKDTEIEKLLRQQIIDTDNSLIAMGLINDLVEIYA